MASLDHAPCALMALKGTLALKAMEAADLLNACKVKPCVDRPAVLNTSDNLFLICVSDSGKPLTLSTAVCGVGHCKSLRCFRALTGHNVCPFKAGTCTI